MNGKALLIIVVLACATSIVRADDDFSYTYLEAFYVNTESSEFEPGVDEGDGEGLQLNGSLELMEHVFLFVDYLELDLDSGLDLALLNPGLGLNFDVFKPANAFLKLGYLHAEVDSPSSDFDDNGYSVAGGLRVRVLPKVELEGEATYMDLDKANGDERVIDAKARYYLTPHVALQGGAEIDSDFDATWLIGVRGNLPAVFGS
jgi:hypothetical protein